MEFLGNDEVGKFKYTFKRFDPFSTSHSYFESYMH